MNQRALLGLYSSHYRERENKNIPHSQGQPAKECMCSISIHVYLLKYSKQDMKIASLLCLLIMAHESDQFLITLESIQA